LITFISKVGVKTVQRFGGSTKAHAEVSPNVRSLTAEACPHEKLFQQALISPIISELLVVH